MITLTIIFIVLLIYAARRNGSSPPPLTAAQQKQLARLEKEKQRENARREKLETQKAQAENDIPFFDIQLQRLYITVEDTRQQYKTACEKVEIDSRFNAIHSSAVKEKIVNKHIAERDKALKKLITLENQIHALEKKKTQAETILQKTV